METPTYCMPTKDYASSIAWNTAFYRQHNYGIIISNATSDPNTVQMGSLSLDAETPKPIYTYPSPSMAASPIYRSDTHRNTNFQHAYISPLLMMPLGTPTPPHFTKENNRSRLTLHPNTWAKPTILHNIALSVRPAVTPTVPR